jgi:uncharacterized protein with FMN-binding domain
MIKRQRPIVMTSLGLVGLSPMIAGCASAVQPVEPNSMEQNVVTAEEAPAPPEVTAPIIAANYADGSYSAQGGYQSPNGPETIELALTLENGVIAAIEVKPGASGGTSERYQGQFAGGIAAETIGKSLDELQVSRIAGSSLTSGGFNQALESIKADANR